MASRVLRKLTVRDGVGVHLREVALLAGAYFVYMFIRRVVVPGAEQTGLDHAANVVSFEKTVGIFWEPRLQHWAIEAGGGVIRVFNYLYIFTYFPVILSTAIFFYFFNRKRYYYYRGLILLSFVFALIIYTSFPLAPPRFIGDPGIRDTIVQFGPPWYGSRESGAYYNAYAAMPSLHFAWTVTFGVLFFKTGPRILKVVGVLYPTMAFLAIVVTGNHYVIDAIGGGIMILFTFLVYEQVVRKRCLARFVPARVAKLFSRPS